MKENRIRMQVLLLVMASFLFLTCRGEGDSTSRPVISQMPQSTTVKVGRSATFNVTATFKPKSATPVPGADPEPLRYQWRKNGVDIPGATKSTYVTLPATASDSGARFTVVVSDGEGSVTSEEAILTVDPGSVSPSITTQPKSATVTAGQTATFNVTAAGTGPLSYQWRKNGSEITDAVSPSYSAPLASLSSSGSKFSVVVTNSQGSVISSDAILTVNPAPATPVITTQPKSTTVIAGQAASFTVMATGTAPLSYQWQKNGIAIGGATSSTYLISTATVSDSGAKFTAVVTNSVSKASSSEATLTVNPVPIQTAWYGFGSASAGGPATNVIHVRNTNDSGAGSLREALAAGNRTIVFDVGGTIQLKDYLKIRDAYITVDGSTAPSPGITLTGYPLLVCSGAHDIILSNFRHRGGWKLADGTRNDEGDCVTIYQNCYKIVLDHLSVSGYQDEGISSWDSNHDITIQNCILGPGSYINPSTGLLEHNFALLIGQYSQRVSVYRNLFAHTNYRNPAVGYDDTNGGIAPSITADVVNNVVWDYTGYGTTVYWGGKGNVVGNYYYSSVYPKRSNHAVNTDTELRGTSFASGNFSKDGSTVSGTTTTPFAVDAYAQIKATSAAEAAAYVKSNAGCRVGGLDATDRTIISELSF